MAVPNIFGSATAAIPLSQLDTNFATPVTIGNTAVQLGNTVTSFGNVTLTNVTISSGNVTITGANVSGTANVSTLIITGNQTSLGNVSITGNVSANIATFGAGSNTAPAITTTGDTNTGIFFPAADTIAFSEGGVEAMRIDSSGNVGIGLTPNAWSGSVVLQMTGPSLWGSTGVTHLSTNTYFDGTNYKYIATNFVTDYYQLSGTHVWRTAASGTAGNNVTFTESMRIDSAGNVGIGTSSPSTPLGAAKGLVIAGGANDAQFRLQNNVTGSTTSDGAILSMATDSNFYLFNYEAGATVFGTNNAERARITSAGSANFFANNPIIAGTSAAANTSSANAIFQGRYSATSTIAGGTDCIFITSNGNIYNTNALYGTLSDAKLKENIVDASSQWDDIKALRVRNFNLKEGQTHTQIGYIAQEVEVVSPSLVDTNPDVDAEGNELGTTTKSLKLSVINIKAVKALQEAMERIERMEAEIAALKGTA